MLAVNISANHGHLSETYLSYLSYLTFPSGGGGDGGGVIRANKAANGRPVRVTPVDILQDIWV